MQRNRRISHKRYDDDGAEGVNLVEIFSHRLRPCFGGCIKVYYDDVVWFEREFRVCVGNFLRMKIRRRAGRCFEYGIDGGSSKY